MEETTKELLEIANNAYFNGTESLIPDAVYDALAEDDSVGALPLGEDKVKLPVRMYSLNKSYEGIPESLLKYDLVQTIKLDGAAVQLQYINGQFHRAFTRGDGEYGRDITEHVLVLVAQKKIPSKVCSSIVCVTGEVAAPKTDNTRNFVSGALNTKVPDTDKIGKLWFAAYDFWDETDFNDILGKGGDSTYTEDQEYLRWQGFSTVMFSNWEGFPTDGIVVRINYNRDYRSLGFTSKFPRGAIALKERKAGVVTTLIDVIWQVGRSGVVTPVALLEPVNIDGATVQRASLHNKKFIKALDISIGDRVEVIRAGDIIPQIVRKIS